MAKFRTTGTCPIGSLDNPLGCGLVLDKIWDTNTPEKVVANVQTRCTRCMTLFMVTNTPVEDSINVTNVNKEVVETITKPLELIIEYTQTTTHYKGDKLPSVTTKPTGRVRTKNGNWFDLPKTSIEKIAP